MYLSQQKAREEREAKRSMIDFRHEYLISTVASTLGLTNDEVTESMLEGTQVCILFLINKYNNWFIK